ncbi:uncharacterized protein [Miscanthus floridulus]|uniref:uncharacterized protein n=1 Tax=Miscanthus floridulus TaxID=154761 RepID=UPI0034596373
MESDLAQTRARLEEALERVKSVHQAVILDLPHVVEEEHARMEQEATASRWLTELERQLESTHRESQDWATDAMEAWAVELLTVERVTAVERGLEAAKVHQVETEAVLQKSLAETEAAIQSSLEALESERKARSEVDQEGLALQGQVLGAEELNARLCEQLASDLVILLLELGGKVGSLKQDLETAKVMIGQNAEALAKSLQERHALEGELD